MGMVEKESKLVELLSQKLTETKTGIIVRGIAGIRPDCVAKAIAAALKLHIYASVVGYNVEEEDGVDCTVKTSVEAAVFWRSNPNYAQKILVFIKEDADKLHSLAEFDVVSNRDLSIFVVIAERDSSKGLNSPTINFWDALAKTADYYSLDSLISFINAVREDNNNSKAIPDNMWRLGLIPDYDILNSKTDVIKNLEKNRANLLAIGQLSEDSRKKLNKTLGKGKKDPELNNAYKKLQNLYKYWKLEDLKELDLSIVQRLFAATKKKTPSDKPPKDDQFIRSKEMNNLVAKSIVDGSEDEMKNLGKLVDEVRNVLNNNQDEDISNIGGIFDNRTIILDSFSADIRKIVGLTCNENNWGCFIRTEDTVLKDIISSSKLNLKPFNPIFGDEITSWQDGSGTQNSLFDFMCHCDNVLKKDGYTIEEFQPILNTIKEQRKILLDDLDLILYYPVLAFGADKNLKDALIKYIESWSELYRVFNAKTNQLVVASSNANRFIADALLLLDVIYIKTPTEWKGVLLPMHPLYLWRYYEVFKNNRTKANGLAKEDADTLMEVLNTLPQVLNFICVNEILASEEKILPCSGNLEMLPTYENKTNRYIGDDGTEAIEEILSRWISFAPYTKNEIRICTVDAPNLVRSIRSIKKFMENTSFSGRIVYDVYLTRKQNGNNELAQLDYSGKDYEIGEFIRQGRISISIVNSESAKEVSTCLDKRPVHIAFYFDQASYKIEFGPNDKSLYVNPLVVTYDYSYDKMEKRGSIYPSSDSDSGLIGNYHRIMKSAGLVNSNMSPHATCNSNSDTSTIVKTLHNRTAQWVVVADRDTNNYQFSNAIPIGGAQYDRRMVDVWSDGKSRIVSQYAELLRNYSLFPDNEAIVSLLKNFGHIATSGLISIPKTGSDKQAIDNTKKGLLGTLFAAAWYTNEYEDSFVVSLDEKRARLWLGNSAYGNNRADLLGVHYDKEKQKICIQPIEVKTRDENADATITSDGNGGFVISGHAAEQISKTMDVLTDIFHNGAHTTDMFLSARREVLKYQIVSECFKNIHDSKWQERWFNNLKNIFNGNIEVEMSGLLLHVKLSQSTRGERKDCFYDNDVRKIEYVLLSADDIQREIFQKNDILKNPIKVDFDDSNNTEDNNQQDFDTSSNKEIVDTNSSESEKSTVEEPSINYQVPLKESEQINCETKIENKGGDEPTEDKLLQQEIQTLVTDFKRACNDYNVKLKECLAENTVVGPSVIRIKFKLARGQSQNGLLNNLEDISREMKRSGPIVQRTTNSDEFCLDVPRLKRAKVLFSDVINKLPKIESPEKLYFPLGRTAEGKDLIVDLAKIPHLLVGGSTGSGKTIFLFAMLAALLKTHPKKDDLQLILSSSKLEDFIHFQGLPHLYSGQIISDAKEATQVIKDVVSSESERRQELLANARVANISQYNQTHEEKLAPIVVVIDEFADLADQLETKAEKEAFYKPVQRIAQAGRSRGIHLVVCTQRPEAKLVPPTTKAQLNGRVALRVNDGISSRMIIDTTDAQNLQKHGDMIYKNGDITERAQGYLIEVDELREIVDAIIAANK